MAKRNAIIQVIGIGNVIAIDHPENPTAELLRMNRRTMSPAPQIAATKKIGSAIGIPIRPFLLIGEAPIQNAPLLGARST